jgi:hypothetical protein
VHLWPDGEEECAALAPNKPRNGASWPKEGRVWCDGMEELADVEERNQRLPRGLLPRRPARIVRRCMTTVPLKLTGDDLVSAFRAGEFEIDCIEMRLTQHKEQDAITYVGPGYIKLSDDGNLEFKVYARDEANTSALASLDAMMKPESGKIYGETDFYTLTAVDRANNQWLAPDLLPHPDWRSLEDVSPIVHGTLTMLRTESGRFAKPARKHLLRLHFFENVQVACTSISAQETPKGTVLTRDHAKFSALGCDFHVSKMDDEIIVEVQSDEPFAPFFETRIIEALQFMVARALPLRMLVTVEGPRQALELSSSVPRAEKPKLDPPLASGYQGYQECFWPLFTRYLKYVVKNNSTQYWHSCSYHLNNAAEASSLSIDTWATAICVAVEGIASLIEVKSTPEEKKTKNGIIDALKDYIDAQAWDGNLKERVKGLLPQIHNVQVRTRLETLRVIGHVDRVNMKAWSDLRNKQAHPKYSDLRNINKVDLQSKLDLISKTTVLMYQIVFHLIGYGGKYVDYGTYGFPVRDYPSQPPEDAPAAIKLDENESVSSFRAFFCKCAKWFKNALRIPFAVPVRISCARSTPQTRTDTAASP